MLSRRKVLGVAAAGLASLCGLQLANANSIPELPHEDLPPEDWIHPDDVNWENCEIKITSGPTCRRDDTHIYVNGKHLSLVQGIWASIESGKPSVTIKFLSKNRWDVIPNFVTIFPAKLIVWHNRFGMWHVDGYSAFHIDRKVKNIKSGKFHASVDAVSNLVFKN